MRVINSAKNLRHAIKQIRSQNKSIGFVPTMGALHEGHLSLIRKCRRENDAVILSIFVNPKQFAPREDFSSYPRHKKKDELFAKREKVDIIFHPSAKTIYPKGYLTYVEVEQLGKVLCGKSRPEHFRGVTTVVAKLLNIVTPDVLYLGQKDAQQAVILKKMISDLNFPVTVRVCPTIREKDGLAMSSRNNYLTAQQREEATVLYQSLKQARHRILSGERDAKRITRMLQSELARHTSGKLDYVACVDAETLTPLKKVKGKVMIALAVWFGKARLIDNIIFQSK